MIVIAIICLIIGLSKICVALSSEDKFDVGIEDANLPIKIDPKTILWIIALDGGLETLCGFGLMLLC